MIELIKFVKKLGHKPYQTQKQNLLEKYSSSWNEIQTKIKDRQTNFLDFQEALLAHTSR